MTQISDMKIKQGDTLSIAGVLKDDGGTPIDLTLYSVTCAVAVVGNVSVLSVTKGDQVTNPGSFTLAASPAQTGGWSPGILPSDIKFVDGAGVVKHTDTFSITVERAVTR